MQAGIECILLVDDDPITCETLSGYFDNVGYRTYAAADAREMQARLQETPIDLLIIDINLPGKDGLEITRELRARSEVGIILLTSRQDDVDKIVGLELGADDYVTKPFNRRELLARAKNLLRRTRAQQTTQSMAWHFDGWQFLAARRQLHCTKSHRKVPLTRAEFELLNTFIQHPGEVLSRELLMRAITHRNWEPQDRTVDVLVRRLRAKLEENPQSPEIIVTAHGEGYLFAAEVQIVRL